MLIDFYYKQLNHFLQLAGRIEANPEKYLQFDSVSEFYQSAWLHEFPRGTHWYVSGLDDGAEEFDVVIYYRDACLQLSCGAEVSAKLIRKH